LNETLDDPTSTNVPSAWRPVIIAPNTITSLFTLLKIGTPVEIKMMAC